MPRSRITRGKLKAEILSNSLIASARNLQISGNRTPKRVESQEWQERAWFWYDTIEVYHYAVQWVGNTLSRAKLTILENGAPTTNAKAVAALAAFYGGAEGQGEYLRQAGIQMTVAGEYYTAVVEIDGDDEWMVAAATEVKNAPGGYTVNGIEISASNSFVFRSWRPHPQKPSQSDCPTRPLLPILSQINELTLYVSAQLDSRLTSNGILLLPVETSFPTPQVTAEGDTAQAAGLDSFMADLNAAMSASKSTRGDAASRVMIGLQAPAEHLDKISLLTPWSPLDEHAVELRDEAIRRLALGMDMPPEALTGTADVNHWGAWQIEDSLIKAHAEPLLALIVTTITEGYLRVVLEEDGMTEEEAAAFSVGTDTAEMRLRPNRSKEAIELGDRLLLSDEAIRRENGFTEEDAPSEDEVNRSLLIKIAQGSPSPEMVQAAAESLGIDLTIPETAPTGGEERPLPRSLEEHPTHDIPDPEDDVAKAALLASAEGAVFRALERAGNKLKSTMSTMQGLPEGLRAVDRYRYVTLSKAGLDNVLEDSWSNLDLITLPSGVPLADFEAHLDNYTRMLISSRQPYDRKLLAMYLDLIERH